MRKAILWMAALCLVALQACKEKENAPAVIGSGTCGAQGDNLTWTLDEKGTLTIKGEGLMEDYPDGGENPSWGIYFKKISSVVIQDGVTSIGESAFCECTNLTSVTLPQSMTSIGDCAFWECTNLTSPITIPEGVTSIGYLTFSGCTSLPSITLPASLTSIEVWAFAACESLTTIIIPANVTNIESSAFADCTGLTEIRVEAAVPPFIVLDEEGTYDDPYNDYDASTFGGVDSSIPVYVPANSVEDYRNSPWGQVFSNIQPM